MCEKKGHIIIYCKEIYRVKTSGLSKRLKIDSPYVNELKMKFLTIFLVYEQVRIKFTPMGKCRIETPKNITFIKKEAITPKAPIDEASKYVKERYNT